MQSKKYLRHFNLSLSWSDYFDRSVLHVLFWLSLQIDNAAKFGAKAAILFSDPEDVALEGQEPEDVYPYSIWLPESGIQRGSAYLGDGDPLTPGWPSTGTASSI